jgi:HKD family nuclease
VVHAIYLADNQTKNLAEVILTHLPWAQDARFAVAFVKTSGLRAIEVGLRKCLDKGATVEFLVGLDFRLTEPKALSEVIAWGRNNPLLSLFCYSNPFSDDAPVYHPKLYIVNKGKAATAVIGSSNLTEGGLRKNIELNIVVELQSQDEFLSILYETYNTFKYQPGRFIPDEEFLENYDQVRRAVRKRENEAIRDPQVRDLMASLKRREAQLPGPKASAKDLYGWQKLVFDVLPEGKFRTSDIYRFEDRFQAAYPENRHVRAKVRQILQQLRDLRLIKHHAENVWER